MNQSLSKNTLFIIGFLFFCIAESIFLIASLNEDFLLIKILLNYLFILAIVPLFYEKMNQGKIDLFSPLAIFSFFYLLLFGIRSIDLLIFGQDLIQEAEKYYVQTLFYAIVGLHFFQIGYFSILGRLIFTKKLLIEYKWSSTRLKILLISYSLISIISFSIIIKLSGGFSYYFQNIHAAMINITTGSALFFMGVLLIEIPLLIWFFNILENKKNLILFSGYFLLVIFLFFSLGERGHLISLIISLLVIYHYARKKLNLLFLISTVGAFIIFLTLYGQYRELTKENHLIKKAGFDSKIKLETIYHYSMYEFDQLIRVKDIVENTPDKISFQYGKTFINLLLKPIPSRIWENKPQGAGVLVTKNLYPKHFSAHVSVAPSLLGELYLNFHLIGVITGFFIFGIIVRALYEFLQNNKNHKNAILIYAFVLPFIYSELRGDFAVVTSFLIFKFIFLVIAITYITRKQIINLDV